MFQITAVPSLSSAFVSVSIMIRAVILLCFENLPKMGSCELKYGVYHLVHQYSWSTLKSRFRLEHLSTLLNSPDKSMSCKIFSCVYNLGLGRPMQFKALSALLLFTNLIQVNSVKFLQFLMVSQSWIIALSEKSVTVIDQVFAYSCQHDLQCFESQNVIHSTQMQYVLLDFLC